jgi:uncharacterized repeat protein (TIGR01451 family)
MKISLGSTHFKIRMLLTGILAMSLVMAAPSPGNSVVLQEMTVAYEGVLAGGIATTGNTVLTCSTSTGPNASDCASARTRSGTKLNNDDFVMSHIKVPFGSLAPTDYFNSSNGQLVLPAGSEIAHATLYWTGTLRQNTSDTPAPNPSLKRRVLFSISNQDCSLKSDPCLLESRISDVYQVNPNTNLGPYRASVDVTNLLSEESLTWTISGPHQKLSVAVANIQTTTGRDKAAGWGLLVAYTNPSESPKHIKILKGFGQESLLEDDEIEFNGFETTSSGDVLNEFAMIAFDGDASWSQDSISTKDSKGSAIISDPVNPDSNIANSTISAGGAHNPYLNGSALDRNKNTFGVDVDQISLINALGYEVDSVDLLPSVTGDTFYISGLAWATEITSPDLLLTKYVSDLTGADPELVEAGDAIEYTITVKNTGRSTAKNVEIQDVLPADLDSVTSTGTNCSAIPAGEICKDLGSIAAGATKTFVINADLNGAAIGTSNMFSNRVTATFSGPLGEQSAVSDDVVTEYGVPAADLATRFNFVRNYIQAGASTTATVIIRNLGPAPDPNPRVRIVAQSGAKLTLKTMPAGCRKLSSTSMECSASAFGISASDPLAAGELANLNFTVKSAVDTSSLKVWATVYTSLATGDPNPENDTSDDFLSVNHKPKAKDFSVESKVKGKTVKVALATKVSDSDRDALKLRLGEIEHGKGKIEGQVFSYTPPKYWSGTFRARYYVSDGKGGLTKAWITITVKPQKPGYVRPCFVFGC